MAWLHILFTDALCLCVAVVTPNCCDQIKPLQDFCMLTIFFCNTVMMTELSRCSLHLIELFSSFK